eukprot:Nk52_evm72s224 gene=Nk52_evmTU72s224
MLRLRGPFGVGRKCVEGLWRRSFSVCSRAGNSAAGGADAEGSFSEPPLRVTYLQNEGTQKFNGVVLVEFSCEETMNALTVKLGDYFERTMQRLSKDNSIRALVLAGRGRAFSAGGDFKYISARTRDAPGRNSFEMQRFYERFLSVRHVPFPTIACIHGAAVGAGCCFTLACDFRIITKQAKFGVNFARLGISPGMAGTHFLPRVSSPQVAARLLLTGEYVNGEEAVDMGLALAPAHEDRAAALDEALSLALKISDASPLVVRSTLRSLRAYTEEGLERQMWLEACAQTCSYPQGDAEEGMSAIREKRDPSFGDFQGFESEETEWNRNFNEMWGLGITEAKVDGIKAKK